MPFWPSFNERDPLLWEHMAPNENADHNNILPSPFMHPEGVKPEYSPVESPGQHKQQTIMNVAVLDALEPLR